MKIHILLLLICYLSVQAERSKPAQNQGSTSIEQTRPSRGRTRFSVTPDFEKLSEDEPQLAPKPRSSTTRKRVHSAPASLKTRTSHHATPIRRYEVQEDVDDIPRDYAKKSFKSKVVTETRFEAFNPPTSDIFNSASTPESPLPSRSTESLTLSNTVTTQNSLDNSESVSSKNEISENKKVKHADEFDNQKASSNDSTESAAEVKRTEPAQTDPSRAVLSDNKDPLRRRPIRTKIIQKSVDTSAPSSNRTPRTRTRPSRKPSNEQPLESGEQKVTVSRNVRRKQAPAVTEPAQEKQNHNNRAVQFPRRKPQTNIINDEVQAVTARPRKGRRVNVLKDNAPSRVAHRPTTEPPKETEKSTIRSPRRTIARTINNSENKNEEKLVTGSKFRMQDFPIDIDEDKLEVLPLFESEDKIVKLDKIPSRRRNLVSDGDSNEITNNFEDSQPINKNPIITSTSRSVRITQRKTPSIETSTKATRSRRVNPRGRAPSIEESVISEITEVTSKKTIIGRRRLPSTTTTKEGESQKLPSRSTSRGRNSYSVKKVNKKKGALTSSEEEIDETDNYPEEFKAILQAKKDKKMSRPESPSEVNKVFLDNEEVSSVTPSARLKTTSFDSSDKSATEDNKSKSTSASTTTTTTSRPARRRFSPSSRKPKIRGTPVTRGPRSSSTSTTENPVKEHKFHARFTSSVKNSPEITTAKTSTRSSRVYSPRPKGYFSNNRKLRADSKQNSISEDFSKTSKGTPSVSIKPANRFSSRYRSDISSRLHLSRSSPTPAYIPTIPTIAETSADYHWPEEVTAEYHWSINHIL